MLVVGATGAATSSCCGVRRRAARAAGAPDHRGARLRDGTEVALADARRRRPGHLAVPDAAAGRSLVGLGGAVAVVAGAGRAAARAAGLRARTATLVAAVEAAAAARRGRARAGRGRRARRRGRRAAGTAAPRLVARHRGDGAEVAARGRARRRALPRAAPARPARPRRACGTCGSATAASATHRDGLPGKKDVVVVPRRMRAGGLELQPFYTVEDNLSVRVGAAGGGPPAAPAGARRRVAPPAPARRRSPSRVHRLALGARRRAAAPRARPPGAGAAAVRVLLLHAYGLGGTVRTSFNLAEGSAAAATSS